MHRVAPDHRRKGSKRPAGGRSSRTTSSSNAPRRHLSFRRGRRSTSLSLRSQGLNLGEKTLYHVTRLSSRLSRSWLTHISLIIMIIIYTFIGGYIFQSIEGNEEELEDKNLLEIRQPTAAQIEKVSAKYVSLSGQTKEKHFKEVTEILAAYETNVRDIYNHNEKMKRGKEELNWQFLNSVFFCYTVITTMGYGHMSPVTLTGRIVVIIYAIIGIPLFLIFLADIGKLLTRGLKIVWKYLRKIYYSTLCQKGKGRIETKVKNLRRDEKTGAWSISDMRVPSEYTVDDKFDVPISVAITILVLYLIIGSGCFALFEGYEFIESVYFVFTSMATIGFGDFVPQNEATMALSVAYLCIGLSLAVMCVNVVRAKLIASFVEATTKFGEAYGVDIEIDRRLLEEQVRRKKKLAKK